MPKKTFKPLDFSKVKTYPLKKRLSKVETALFGKKVQKGARVRALIEGLPDILAAQNLKAIARKILGRGVAIRGALVQIGPHPIDRSAWDWRAIEDNPFWCPDAAMALRWADYLDTVRKAGSSAGAVIEIVASGVPAGLGEPIYDKLDGDLARALMTINAVKGVEIGSGFAAATLKGEDNADEMRIDDGRVVFLSNNAGGILGGISTGQDIVARFAVKPTSSILNPLRTVDVEGNEVEISTHGRHDPCVGIRAVPVGEAMVASVLADHLLRHRALTGDI